MFQHTPVIDKYIPIQHALSFNFTKLDLLKSRSGLTFLLAIIVLLSRLSTDFINNYNNNTASLYYYSTTPPIHQLYWDNYYLNMTNNNDISGYSSDSAAMERLAKDQSNLSMVGILCRASVLSQQENYWYVTLQPHILGRHRFGYMIIPTHVPSLGH